MERGLTTPKGQRRSWGLGAGGWWLVDGVWGTLYNYGDRDVVADAHPLYTHRTVPLRTESAPSAPVMMGSAPAGWASEKSADAAVRLSRNAGICRNGVAP